MLTIKVPRDRKRFTFTVSPYVDPTVKRLRKLKMPKFESDTQVDEEILRSIMNIGLLEVKPAWFELLLSPKGWLEGDILFPANVNGIHWVVVEVNLKERAIKVYDSYPYANSVDEILRSDCGIFTLKFLEYLWAEKQFDFEAKDGAPVRVKITT
ncbi:hypothetical protein Ddye_001281 [Dipteronia dyeriana]|uniref:Ubiquitin-like protease family profile domain-containing protein n=1 Tax=Dipteronia dyeriana TaxID=168575 RepID=A0AAD9XNQ2_9ROSI|nr:hypothetical protein Ddye_001281 [Dipteronia dyeriana]